MNLDDEIAHVYKAGGALRKEICKALVLVLQMDPLHDTEGHNYVERPGGCLCGASCPVLAMKGDSKLVWWESPVARFTWLPTVDRAPRDVVDISGNGGNSGQPTNSRNTVSDVGSSIFDSLRYSVDPYGTSSVKIEGCRGVD